MATKSSEITGNNAPAGGPEKLNRTTRPLSPKAGELLQEQSSGLPIWIRAPKVGVEHHTGFSRSKLYELAGKGLIRSVSIREPGQVKGTRIFNLQSILDLIARCEEEAKGA
jgi:hypothetical protein